MSKELKPIDPIIEDITRTAALIRYKENRRLSPTMSNLSNVYTLVCLIEKAINKKLTEELKQLKLPSSSTSLNLEDFGRYSEREKKHFFTLEDNSTLRIVETYLHFTFSFTPTYKMEKSTRLRNKIRITLGIDDQKKFFSVCDQIQKIILDEKMNITYKVRSWDSYQKYLYGNQSNWEATGKDFTIYAHRSPHQDWKAIINEITDKLNTAAIPKRAQPFTDLPLKGGYCAARNDSFERKQGYQDVIALWKKYCEKLNSLFYEIVSLNTKKSVLGKMKIPNSGLASLKNEKLLKEVDYLSKKIDSSFKELFTQEFKNFYLLHKVVEEEKYFSELPTSFNSPETILLIYDLLIQHNLRVLSFKETRLDNTIIDLTDINSLKHRREIIKKTNYHELTSIMFDLRALVKILMPKFEESAKLLESKEKSAVNAVTPVGQRPLDILKNLYYFSKILSAFSPKYYTLMAQVNIYCILYQKIRMSKFEEIAKLPESKEKPSELINDDKLTHSTLRPADLPPTDIIMNVYRLSRILIAFLSKNHALSTSVINISRSLYQEAFTNIINTSKGGSLLGYLAFTPSRIPAEQRLSSMFKERIKSFYLNYKIADQNYFEKLSVSISDPISKKLLVIYDLVIQNYVENNPDSLIDPVLLKALRENIIKINNLNNFGYLLKIFSFPPLRESSRTFSYVHLVPINPKIGTPS